MSGYEELVERCCMLFRELESSAPNDEFTHRAYAKTLLTSVLRPLETVTPEMQIAAGNADVLSWSSEEGEGLDSMDLEAAWLAMLRVSPLVPPKETK